MKYLVLSMSVRVFIQHVRGMVACNIQKSLLILPCFADCDFLKLCNFEYFKPIVRVNRK
jgi:hypothetical protein